MKFNLKSFRLGDLLSKRINTILLIIILILILTGHVVCSCSKITTTKIVEKLSGMNSPDFRNRIQSGKIKDMMTKREGFTGANTNNGQSASYSLGSKSGTVAIEPNSWNQPDLVVNCNGSYGKGVSDILNRAKQPIPLPEGEMDILATTKFKPECCPNFYSISTGCACMTTDQYNYLVTRGGNNVPYSEY
jgi:hypothetical protein